MVTGGETEHRNVMNVPSKNVCTDFYKNGGTTFKVTVNINSK
jgi:hypothetical protein